MPQACTTQAPKSRSKPSTIARGTAAPPITTRRSASSSTGYIIASTKYLRCHFKRSGRDEYYRGTVSKFGIDIGSTKQTAISWAVLAPTSNLPPRSLNGNYGGVGAEATVGLGVGANALLGGSSRSIILQPLSVQAQKGGFNLAAGVQSLEQFAPRAALFASGQQSQA